MDQQNQIRIDVVGNVDGLKSTAVEAERELNRVKDSALAAGEGLNKAGIAADILSSSVSALTGVSIAVTGGLAAWAAAQIAATFAIKDSADEVGKLAQRMGETSQSVSELRYIFGMAGASTEEMASLMKSLDSKAQDAARGVGQASSAYKAMGVSATDSNGKMKDGRVLLEEISDKLSEYKDSATKAALVQDALGSGWVKLIPMLNGGSASFREASEEARQLGVVFDEKLIKQSAELNDNLYRIKAASEAAKISLGSELLPTVVRLSEEFVQGRKNSDGFVDALLRYGLTNPFVSQQERLTALRKEASDLEDTMSRGRGKDGDEEKLRRLNQEINYYDTLIQKKAASANADSDRSIKSDAPLPRTKQTSSDVISDYQRLIQTLNEKISVETADLQSVEKLSHAEKEFAKYQADLISGRLELSSAEKQVTAAFWETYLARAKANAEEKDAKKGDDLIREYQRKAELELNQIKRGADLASMSERERVAAEALYKAEKEGGDIRDKIINQLPEGAARINALAKANSVLEGNLIAVRDAALENYDAQRGFEFGWKKAMQSYSDNATDAAATGQAAFTTMTNIIEDSLTSFATNTKYTFKDMAQSILKYLAQVAAKQAAMGLMKTADSVWGSYFGQAGSGYGQTSAQAAVGADINSAGLGGFAKGGAFSDGVQAFAQGGAFTNSVVSSPTLFRFANGGKFGLMGEAGPEAVMPLTRDASGRLGVTAAGGGGNEITIQQIFNISKDGASQDSTTSSDGSSVYKQFADMAANAAKQVIVQEMRSGGLLSTVKA